MQARVYLQTGELIEPCLNDGTCNQETFVCDCTLSFTGSMCETEISPCETLTPCQNGATCVDQLNGFTCTCAPGFSGEKCDEVVPACSSEPCLNGATCSEEGPGAFSCACPSGFTGPTCADEVNECASSPCLNGAVCADNVDSYSCTCAAGFFGTRCETGRKGRTKRNGRKLLFTPLDPGHTLTTLFCPSYYSISLPKWVFTLPHGDTGCLHRVH